jgi:hypothetical protein
MRSQTVRQTTLCCILDLANIAIPLTAQDEEANNVAKDAANNAIVHARSRKHSNASGTTRMIFALWDLEAFTVSVPCCVRS